MAFLLALALVVSVMSGLGLSVSAEQESNTPGTEEVQQQDKTEAGAAPSAGKAEEEAAKPEEKPVQEEKEDEQKTEAKENADKPAEKQEKATPKAGENVQTATIGTGDKTVTVKTTAAAGVLPEGAKLVVKKLADQDQAYQDAESTLKDSQVTYDDFLALDVGFEVNGKEVEPEAGSVQVQFELGAGLLPETANLDSLSVQHLTDGKAETVTNEVDVTESGVKADFTVSSFSTFTITWWGDDYKKYYEFTAHYIDEKGNAINPSASNVELSDGTTINFRNVYGSSINGYDFVGAYYGTYNNANAITTMQATKTAKWESYYQRTYYTVTFKNNSTSVQSFEQKKSDSPTVQKGNIYLVFKKDTTGDTGGTIGDITLPAPGHTKKAVRKDDGTYDLSLDVSGSIGSEAKKIPLDVVMIIDRSASMANNSKMTNVKSAASNLISTLSGNKNLDVHYNIVTFHGKRDPTENVTSTSGWTQTSEAATSAVGQINAYNNQGEYFYNAGGGTNYQAGIRVAKQQLNLARTGAQTVVIFFTDGIPTFRWSNPVKETTYVDYTSFDYYYGNGNDDDGNNNINAAAAEIKGMYTNRFYAVGAYSNNDKDKGTKNLQTLVKSVNAGDKQEYTTTNSGQIEEIFKSISSEILKLTCTEVSITDTLNDNAQIVKNADGQTPLTITVTDKSGTVKKVTGYDNVSLIVPLTKQNGGEEKDRTLTATYVENAVNGRQIKLIFPDAYSLEADYTYTVTTPIEPTEKAYEKYRDGKETYPNTPDAGTGTHAEKRENGFYCNDTAQLKYNNTKGDKTVAYDKPVIQLTPGKLVIKKTIAGELTDEQVTALENALTFKYKLNNGTEQSAKLTDWTKDETTGTYTASATVASGLSPDTEYTVTEDADSAKVEGYDVVTDPANNEGTIGKGKTETASFTNTYTKATQDLTITKKIEKNATFTFETKDYTFTVTANKIADVAGKSYTTDKNTNVSFNNIGVATVTIQGEDSIKIKDLPVGGYTVEEQAPEDVDVTGYDFVEATYAPTGGKTTLTSNAPGTVTVTNKYEIKKIAVNVKKELTGNMYNSGDTFNFTATGCEKEFELGKDQTREFTVNYGTKFEVTETDDKGYTLESIRVDSGGDTGEQDGSKYTINSVTKPTTIIFTNKKQINPPNGITTTIAPYAIMVVLAAGAGVYFVYSRRRRNH